jgi:DtxR family Mn-dependent transcriptional regulator
VKITISKENYLKTIAEAENDGETVIAALLARWLNVSAPAVAMATRRLTRDGLVSVARTGRITLTPAGREIASRLMMRHHLIERMLTEVFGMEWYKVHDEAEQLEHAVSEDFERRLREKLGEDGPCPHGSRLRNDRPVDRRKRGLVPLAELAPDRGATVECVFERDRALLEYLDSLGIRPGSSISVVAKNCDETYSLRVRKKTAPLGRRAAERIWVRPESAPRSTRRSS